MSAEFVIDAAGISRRHRRLSPADIRRIHAYTDADGEAGIVVRGSRFRLIFVPRSALAEPGLADGFRALLAALPDPRTADPLVREWLRITGRRHDDRPQVAA